VRSCPWSTCTSRRANDASAINSPVGLRTMYRLVLTATLLTSIVTQFLRLMLRWFKNDFFKWVDKLSCELCGGGTDNIGMGQPAPDELSWGGSRVELYKCHTCRMCAL